MKVPVLIQADTCISKEIAVQGPIHPQFILNGNYRFDWYYLHNFPDIQNLIPLLSDFIYLGEGYDKAGCNKKHCRGFKYIKYPTPGFYPFH